MQVIKRNGKSEPVKFDKILARISKQAHGLSIFVDPAAVAQRVVSGLYDGVTTTELDNLAAETAAAMITRHPDYGMLAAKIAVSAMHKETDGSFVDVIKTLYKAGLVSRETLDITNKHAFNLEVAIDYSKDYDYDYFGFRTLEKSYLMRVNGKVVERPQDMLMRVAIGVSGDDLQNILDTYGLLANRYFTHATPTLFNAGTPKPQMSSCFLLDMKDDSIDGIYDTLKQSALISQSAGGIGISATKVRAKGSHIKGTNGQSNGLVPMMRVFNDTARYVDQGGGKRKGAIAMYLEPWHADIFDFLDLRKNHGKEEMRARDLFLALWIPDLFMRRVEEGGVWSLMCPNECPGLDTSHSEGFEQLYHKYEAEGKFKKQIPARELWAAILIAQEETGTPYMLFKDQANRKSNQKNLGTIKSSNLCTEIIQYTSPTEIAVCNLASLALPRFVEDRGNGFMFNHDILFAVTYQVTINLNRVIDRNYYPVPEAEVSNKTHRPIGLGVQGLADVFAIMQLPFDSPEARKLNTEIFETIYFASMTASKDLAIKHGAYASIAGSPIDQGTFQFDMWGVKPTSGRWDWDKLRNQVVAYGVRNSLLLAPMPTASTAQILGNNEAFEAFTSNLYVRRVLSGEFININKHLVKELIALDRWDEEMRNAIIANNGSIQSLDLPQHLKDIYRTVWEISQKSILEMSADRGAYICQSQSLNIHMVNVNTAKLSSMHFHAWKLGLKTGMYYLRTKAAADAIKFTVEPVMASIPEVLKQYPYTPEEAVACSLDNPEACEACGA